MVRMVRMRSSRALLHCCHQANTRLQPCSAVLPLTLQLIHGWISSATLEISGVGITEALLPLILKGICSFLGSFSPKPRLCSGASTRPEPGAVCAFSLWFLIPSLSPFPRKMQLLGRAGKTLPFPTSPLSASFFISPFFPLSEELSALKSKLLLKAGLGDSQTSLMATKNAASSGAGEKKVLLRTKNSTGSSFLALKTQTWELTVVHVTVVCTTRMCAGYSL